MAGGIEDIIDILYNMVEDAHIVPFGKGKAMVDREKVLDLLDEVRGNLPADIKAAHDIVEKRNELLEAAKKEAEAIANAQVTDAVDANGYQAVKVTFDSGILFQSGKSVLSAAAQSSLTQFATNVLGKNADMNVGIVGFTDNDPWTGKTAEQSVAANQKLSEERAEAVSNFLQKHGAAANQIKEVVGLGESNPVADNSTAAGKQQNRRVEVYLYASQEMIDAAKEGTLK